MTLDLRKAAVAAALALAALGSWWLARTVAPPPPEFNGKSRHDPDYIVENFNATVMNENGRRKYLLSAKRLVHYGDDASSFLEQPYLIQYAEGLAPTHTRADTGWMPKEADEIRMSGHVQVARGRDPRGAGAEIRADKMNVRLNR